MFLSRLNEISGGCEKIVPVSELFWSNLKITKLLKILNYFKTIQKKKKKQWTAQTVKS